MEFIIGFIIGFPIEFIIAVLGSNPPPIMLMALERSSRGIFLERPIFLVTRSDAVWR